MSVDYDLIVIGSTYEAIYAASRASDLKMRVALVEQSSNGQLRPSDEIFGRTYSQFTQLLAQVNQISPALAIQPNWLQVKAWTEQAGEILSEYNSLALLAARGVDVIAGSGEFCRLPHLGLIVDQRRLRSRTYLLATGSIFTPPEIVGLAEVNYLTVSDIWHRDTLDDLPEKLTIVGETATAVQLAQTLTRVGKQVTLFIESQRLFPLEDPEISWLLQAQLEAEGIYLFTGISVTHIKVIDGKKWLQVGNQAIEADEVILASRSIPNIEGFNLEGVDVQIKQNSILVNDKFQTTNSRIYACGDVLGGALPTQIAQHEVDVILKNILFYPLFRANYSHLPFSIATTPPLARVGLTETQARKRFADNIYILQQPYKINSQAQLLGQTTGFCKLIVDSKGYILGGHIIGVAAEEIIGVIALAVKYKITIQSLAGLPFPSLTISEIIHQTALEWQRQSLLKRKGLLNWLETWSIWRRKLVKE
jgi:pyruvate/2-oxoglutarate dehydrogenase complex dihydrolipoamide dehydrogenase (E3) component